MLQGPSMIAKLFELATTSPLSCFVLTINKAHNPNKSTNENQDYARQASVNAGQ